MLIALLVAAVAVTAPASASAVALEQVGSFERPTDVSADPRDPERVFVVEQPGRVQLLAEGADPTLFLDVESFVSDTGSAGNHGLLSIAFSPDHHLYAAYSGVDDPDTDGVDETGDLHITEFGADGDSADPATARDVLTIDFPPGQLHRGGQLNFGPDGYLYASVGDGGPQGDPNGNAQSLQTLRGKILRIDPRGSVPGEHTVPADNPFADQAGCEDGCDEIWSYGLRNPWQFSFDRLTGGLTVGDVGQRTWEEVNFDPGPAPGRADNFGWNCREGAHDYTGPDAPGPGSPSPECPGRVGSFTEPVFEYQQVNGNCAITGGYVVRDRRLPDLYGRYLYADFCVGELRSLSLGLPAASGDRPEGLEVPSVTSFGEDAVCRIYVASFDGAVYRLTDPAAPGTAGCLPPGSPPGPSSGTARPASDTTPPRVDLYGERKQRVGPIEVRVRCDSQCAVATRGKVLAERRRRGVVAGVAGKNRKRFRLDKVTAASAAGEITKLKLRPHSRSANRRIKRQVERGNRARARVRVVASDRAGNSSADRLTVRLIGRHGRGA